ncbi:hypothetical protein [Nesterenkonia sp. HG001]|uniref:hypothetical protein n=1 Tax=Nesterenkonia sp. HG001 TaxID=2983207 RepID=UPI002AC63854|nr:hypothetical protein [Nesterenkonia sp. HG001]MDZ5076007.1 hypothetical protein [Nesterenkonia sp. HG001]
MTVMVPGQARRPTRPTGSARPPRRRAERALLFIAAGWNAVLAVITLFPFQYWFASSGYQGLEEADALGSASMVTEVAAVVRTYGIAVLVGALLTAVIAWRLKIGHSRAVTWWLVACVVGTFITRDVVSVLLFSVCLAVYLSRSRALRLHAEAEAARAREAPA